MNEQDKAALLDALKEAMKDSIRHTYPVSATEYLDWYKPDRIAINKLGHWFKHPDDDLGLLLIFPFDDQIHLTGWRQIPTPADVGLENDSIYVRRPLPRVQLNNFLLEFD